jgi:heat shock protein HslJ
MNTRLTIIILSTIALGGVWYWLAQTPAPTSALSYKNATYVIEGQSVTLVNGRAEITPVPNSVSKTVTQYFGNEATGDLNGDGVADVAFLLTQTTDGSGTFYYAVAAIKTADGYQGTSAVLLGDRVAPQTTEIRNGQLIVNYADRAVGEPMTAKPSEGKSLFLKLNTATLQFGEVVQNFEGEADPSSMTLDMKTWVWIKTLYNNDTTVVPEKATAFTLTFKKDGTFSATTDCNSMGGKYTTTNTTISFSNIFSTKMFCEGSQEDKFAAMLQETQDYHFTPKGELVFSLKFDSGSFIFR